MSDRTIVILIHGIRTAAWWQNRVASILEKEANATVIPLKYGYFDIIRFWCPFSICRSGPINRLREQFQGIRDQYRDRRLVVFAHSYGTYALSKILIDNPSFRFDRVILCGSIIPQSFKWSRVQEQILSEEKRNAIINECGLRDVWPVLAETSSWGYGASGTFGFGVFNVRDRFHPIRHSEFFVSDRVRQYWVPAVLGDPIEFSESDTIEGRTPGWFTILRMLPIRWLALIGIAALVFAAVTLALSISADLSCRRRDITRTSRATGADGTMYEVHNDFSRGPEKSDRWACGRQYWISADTASRWHGIEVFYLVDSKGERRSDALYIENADGTLTRAQ